MFIQIPYTAAGRFIVEQNRVPTGRRHVPGGVRRCGNGTVIPVPARLDYRIITTRSGFHLRTRCHERYHRST